jgi:hypothetical protein
MSDRINTHSPAWLAALHTDPFVSFANETKHSPSCAKSLLNGLLLLLKRVNCN